MKTSDYLTGDSDSTETPRSAQASKPPAPPVVETPMTDAALRDWRLEHYDRRLEMVAQESRTLERSLTAAQLEIERLKADVAKLEKQLARTPTRCNEEQRK